MGVRQVLVVGTGLIGTSVGLALRKRGIAAHLSDADPDSVAMARNLGAGHEWDGVAGMDVAVLAVPPRAVADVLADLQARSVAAAYTDVASVKMLPTSHARRRGCDLRSYVPGHPLAGRERSGPAAARGDLFLGRPWALCPLPETSSEALTLVCELVASCGAEPVRIAADEHDEAVALVSHAPHVASAAMAARLLDASDAALRLSGQGLRDVTRIAASDPALWTDILAANAGPVAAVLERLAADLAVTASALRTGQTRPVTDMLRRGADGRRRLPGKRGGPALAYQVVPVVVSDRPGELARLFAVAGKAGVNIEDVTIEHSPGLPVGVVELTVRPEAAAKLAAAVRAQGWSVHR